MGLLDSLVSTVTSAIQLGDGQGLLDIAAALDNDPETKALNLDGESLVTSVVRSFTPGTHLGTIAGDVLADSKVLEGSNFQGAAAMKGGSSLKGTQRLKAGDVSMPSRASSAGEVSTALDSLFAGNIYGPTAFSKLLQDVQSLSKEPIEYSWALSTALTTKVTSVTLTSASPSLTIMPTTGITTDLYVKDMKFWCDAIVGNDSNAKARVVLTGRESFAEVFNVQGGAPLTVPMRTTVGSGFAFAITAEPTPAADSPLNVSFTGMARLAEWKDL